MAVEYAWAFGPLRVMLHEGALDNVVYVVHWRLTGQDENVQSSVYGSVQVPAPDPENFIPFESLTKSQVQNWVEELLGESSIIQYKQMLAKNIELQKTPEDALLPPPWNN